MDRGVLTTEFKITLLAPATGERIVARGKAVLARVMLVGLALMCATTAIRSVWAQSQTHTNLPGSRDAYAEKIRQTYNFAFGKDNLASPGNARAEGDEFIQPESGPGPIKSDPSRPYISNAIARQETVKIADLTSELELLQQAKEDALAILAEDLRLSKPEHRALRAAVQRQFADTLPLAQIG